MPAAVGTCGYSLFTVQFYDRKVAVEEDSPESVIRGDLFPQLRCIAFRKFMYHECGGRYLYYVRLP